VVAFPSDFEPVSEAVVMMNTAAEPTQEPN
jgi:hypothetical protein